MKPSHGEKMLALYEKMQTAVNWKLPEHHDAENVLPELDLDFAPLFEAIIPKDTERPSEGTRRDYKAQKQILRAQHRGTPEILALHMLCISYLRRNTPHTEHARTLFFRLWSEHTEALLEIMKTRDLISALRSFADHDRNTIRRLGAKMGFIHATMIKAYESERVQEGLPLDFGDYEIPTKNPKIGLEKTFGMRFGTDNSLDISNVLILEEVLSDAVIGPMLLSLLVRLYEGDTIFSRTDEARIRSDYHLDEAHQYIGWSWGFDPRPPLVDHPDEEQNDKKATPS